jgi:hypothetical protein
MKGLMTPVMLIAAGVIGITQHDVVADQWAAMFPDNPARQAALTKCFEEDKLFNRFSSEARAACYQKWLDVTDQPGGAPPSGIMVVAPNAIDQARAAGAGHMPKNDVRNLDANERYRHPHQ